MRIITGRFKGRRLVTPKSMAVRPTSDRVKESVFSIIRDQVIDTKFLDMCAGTGNIGIEALSRGARQVTFLERNPKSLQIIKRNLHICGLDISNPQVQLIGKDVRNGIATLHKRSETFELIYFDPPYDAGIYNKCILQISDTNLLKSTGLLLVEHHKNNGMPLKIGMLTYEKQKQYGDTCLTFFRSNMLRTDVPM